LFSFVVVFVVFAVVFSGVAFLRVLRVLRAFVVKALGT
jgi:hypothetical protein